MSMAKGRVLRVECQCGQPLFKYYKAGRGRLIKCYLDEVREDYAGIAESANKGRSFGQQPPRPTCPACGRELGEIRLVRGRPALKLNQGTIQKVRI
jgi:hypothetical protein